MHENRQNAELFFDLACGEVGVREEDKHAIDALLAPMREKNGDTHEHYLHMLRVGVTAMKIARFLHHEEKPLLIAGALHDLGKIQSPPEVLGKKEGWHGGDAARMRAHVLDGYRMLRGRFDFTAEIVVLHHHFQERSYPRKLPIALHEYDEPTKLLIYEYGRILALADHIDAAGRCDKGTCPTRQGVKKKVLEGNPDRKKLIEALFAEAIV